MIATLNGDCSVLTLNSSGLDLTDGRVVTSLELKYRLGCSSTENTVDVSELIPDITNSEIEVPSTLFYGADTSITYCDNVYYFQLEVFYTLEDVDYLVEDSACQIVDCTLKCDVLDYYIATKDKKAFYLYYALTLGNDCDSCYCTEMCSLYTELKTLLNDNGIITDTTGCGCS